jgi:1-acyl-sn-glycerol-3-phosphate acyltransferase
MSHKTDILDFEPLSPEAYWRRIAPLRFYFRPEAFGLEHVDPERPALYVGNHTLYAIVDWPIFMGILYKERGVYVRSLADRLHYQIPYWRDFIARSGVVEGSRENCDRLMKAGCHVLVYPGGAREICKRKGEAYTLTWKERLGFARMAVKHGYPIIPFASVGPDNMCDVVLDAEDIKRSPLGAILRATGVDHAYLRDGDLIPPVTRGLGLTPFPRPERFYFSCGEPIETAQYDGRYRGKKVLREVRDQVESAVYKQIRELLLRREQDTSQSFLRRALQRL